MKRKVCHSVLGLVSLLMLSACSAAPHTASFSGQSYAAANSCTALGYTPGSAQYNDCQQDQRIREEVLARKALNGNKNQPDGVMAQTYGKRMGVMINCTSYQGSCCWITDPV